jgi:hypothetical protein
MVEGFSLLDADTIHGKVEQSWGVLDGSLDLDVYHTEWLFTGLSYEMCIKTDHFFKFISMNNY